MSKAQFHKNQRVYVKPVGTWAVVDKVLPQWTTELPEPSGVHYDVGLGREFTAEELTADASSALPATGDAWRLVRARNKWQRPEECAHHPHPGTYPVIVTGQTDWGGWRVPGAEYDLYPERIEAQARLMGNAPRMMMLIRKFAATMAQYGDNPPPALAALADEAQDVLDDIQAGDH